MSALPLLLTMNVWHSGGHTSEALSLMSSLDFRRYSPRVYFVSESDTISAQKAETLEVLKGSSSYAVCYMIPPYCTTVAYHLFYGQSSVHTKPYTVLIIPRARRVHQSLLTTPLTALPSLLFCLYYVIIAPILSSKNIWSPFADVLVVNGPGTCFILCVAVYVSKVSELSY